MHLYNIGIISILYYYKQYAFDVISDTVSKYSFGILFSIIETKESINIDKNVVNEFLQEPRISKTKTH